jgi:MoaA/NifB/PqqE/SkfB family radical SAM enzyme
VIKLLFKIPVYLLARWGYPVFSFPFNVTFVVTDRCNAKCKTCFKWRKDQGEIRDSSLDEYRRIVASMGRVFWLTLSGGEVFLREDINDLIEVLCSGLRPSLVTIATNGTQPLRVEKVMRDLSHKYPKIKFIINFSIDHIEEKHDAIRGLSNNFSLVIDSIQRIKKMSLGNVLIGVNMVISKYNFGEFLQIYEWIQKHISPDSFSCEIAQIREEFLNHDADFCCTATEYASQLGMLLGWEKDKGTGLKRIKNAFRTVYYKAVRQYLVSGNHTIRCFAGFASCLVDANLEVFACGVKKTGMGELKDYNYNFKMLWNSTKAKTIRKQIKQNNCFCPMSNVMYTNLLLNPNQWNKLFFILLGGD